MSDLTILALSQLLACYNCDARLWNLYYTCSSLFHQKSKNILNDLRVYPEIIYDPEKCGELFIVNPHDAYDGFYTPSVDSFVVFMKCNWSWYSIPRAWCDRIYFRDGCFFLYKDKFCCRPKCVKDVDGILPEVKVELSSKIYFDKTFYHYGVSRDCGMKFFFEGIDLFFGWSQLYTIFAKHDDKFKMTLLSVLKSKDNLKRIQHCLLCKQCNHILEPTIVELNDEFLRSNKEPLVELPIMVDYLIQRSPYQRYSSLNTLCEEIAKER